MTFDRAIEVITKLSYKPEATGRWIDLQPSFERNTYILSIFLERPDSEPPHTAITIGHMREIPTWMLHFMTQGMLLRLIRKELRKAEAHEVDEWFRIETRHVRAPHR